MEGRSLAETPTWAVAVVCFVLLSISIFIEHILHLIGKWLKQKQKSDLYESLEKIKSELMLLGFISLLLTVGQGVISRICITEKVADTFHPCPKDHHQNTSARRLLSDNQNHRRILAAGGSDKCPPGKVPFVSSEGIHQLHIFIFVLAVFHVLYCILTLALGRAKMRRWKRWEEETKTAEYQFSHDPERFRFARETSFGRRHLKFWTQNLVLVWIVCFFRQFVRSVPKVDYLTLRHGFMMAHLGPQSHMKFDFRQYIKRSLEEDFKVVVEISPPIWFITVFFLLFNTHGWYSYLWLPFVPLIIILLVGTKLQVIITKMGQRIEQRGEVVKGVPLVQPGDDLFWFKKPRLILYLINFVLFQNAFQMAFFSWTALQFRMTSCFHSETKDMAIRISMGVFVQFLCSYVTLPSYALVTQMGSTMKPTIFSGRVAKALRKWHHTAKEHVKQNRGLQSHNSLPCKPTTPKPPTSPAQLLRHCHSQMDTYPSSPTRSDSEAQYHYEIDSTSFSDEHHHKSKAVADSNSIQLHEMEMGHLAHDQPQRDNEPSSTLEGLGLSHHEIHIEHTK
ncbi:MLO-like protein 6 [Cajanus cajan]|uniref:MLO-like protein n=3 Tax=Cajanus cajan TaxID=3821 RepID=A0A151RFW7_CAJCA|nr:MLO-like protein 6 [Cajanus cajan]KYP41466.1 MLO-like protein 6 [Cajanus cajan]